MTVTLFGKKSFCKHDQVYVLRRDCREDTETERVRRRWRLELCPHKPRDAWSCQRLEEPRKGPLLETSKGVRPCQLLDFRLLAPRVVGVNFPLLSVTQSVVVC